MGPQGQSFSSGVALRCLSSSFSLGGGGQFPYGCFEKWEWNQDRCRASWPLTRALSPLFSQSLLSRFVDGLTFKVNFTFNRQPLRVQHRALELTGRWPLWPMLFPTASRGVPLLPSDVKLK